MDPFRIDALDSADWPAVRAIFEEGIATRQATFETAAPDWEGWNAAHRPDCRLVARRDGRILGWAALSPVSKRAVYSGVAIAPVGALGHTTTLWHSKEQTVAPYLTG